MKTFTHITIDWSPILQKWAGQFLRKKCVKIGEHYYRIRRGKPVRIPIEWVGKVAHPQTIRKRKRAAYDKKHNQGDYRRRGKPDVPPEINEWDPSD